jgi:hypothetical protein
MLARLESLLHPAEPPLPPRPFGLALTVLGLLAFASLAAAVLAGGALVALDHRVLAVIADWQMGAPGWLLASLSAISAVNQLLIPFLSGGVVLFWLWNGPKRAFYLLLASGLGGQLLWLAILFAVGRPRPQGENALVPAALPRACLQTHKWL